MEMKIDWFMILVLQKYVRKEKACNPALEHLSQMSQARSEKFQVPT